MSLSEMSASSRFCRVIPGAVLTVALVVAGPARGAPGAFKAPWVPIEVGLTAYDAAAGDFDRDGDVDIAVVAPESLVILLGDGKGAFSPGVRYPINQTTTLSTVDLNGDGVLDLVLADRIRRVSVVLGRGDGTFQPQRVFLSDLRYEALAVGDLDEDAVPDLILSDWSNDAILVFPGDGVGSFLPAHQLFNEVMPQGLTVGDANGDGHPDIVSADWMGSITLFPGRGDLTFDPSVNVSYPGYPWCVAIGDMNGDDIPDVVYTREYDLGVVLGQGDGTFAPATRIEGAGASFLVLADLDGDGNLDASGSDRFSRGLRVWWGGEGGITHPPVVYPAGAEAASTIVADLDGDDRLDLATACGGSRAVALFRGRENGTFENCVEIPVGDWSESVIMGDVNRDGLSDALVVDYSGISVLVGLDEGFLERRQRLESDSYIPVVALGDVNQDGFLDAVAATQRPSSPEQPDFGAAVYPGRGDGTFAPPLNLAPARGSEFVVVEDLNRDGDLDLILAGYEPATISAFLGREGWGFEFAGEFPYPSASSSLSDVRLLTGDLDGDGAPELLVSIGAGSREGSGLWSFRGRGDGTFEPPVAILTGFYPGDPALGDLDRDGDLDVVVAESPDDWNAGPIGFRRGRGDGTFEAPSLHAVLRGAGRALIVDLDRDGWPDVVTLDGPGKTLSVLAGLGNGDLAPAVSYGAGPSPTGLAAGDVDGDGRLDLMTSNDWSENVLLILQERAASFTPTPDPPALLLAPPAPNPFSAEARLFFETPVEGFVDLTIHDVLGRRIRSLWSGILPGGPHEMSWDGRNDSGERAAQGLYFLHLRSESVKASRKIILAR